jgi:hypothetical protein
VSARVTQTGTYVNSATGTGDGKDTNGANTDDASTLVTAPVTPPSDPAEAEASGYEGASAGRTPLRLKAMPVRSKHGGNWPAAR